MAKLDIQGGSTSVDTLVFIQDSTSTAGAGLANLTATTAGLTCYYALPGLAAVAVSLATQTATGTFASGGFAAEDNTNMPGVYRLGLINASLASTSRSSVYMLKGAANMAPLPLEIQLTGWNNQDQVRGGLTALPTALAGTSSGLILGDANGRVGVGNWAGFSAATTQLAISTSVISSSTNVNVISWAGFNTATTQLAVLSSSIITVATNVNVTGWAGFAAATTQIAVATAPVSANVTLWAGFAAATTQLAISTTAVSSATNVNVISWAGFNTATTQLAVLSSTALTGATNVNVIGWAGFAAATTQAAISTSALGNVTAWAGAPTATTQLAISTQAFPANFGSLLISSSGQVEIDATSLANIWAVQVDGTVTAAQSLRLANSANGGILGGATTTVINIRDLANSKNRILASGDAQGNRLAVTLDLT